MKNSGSGCPSSKLAGSGPTTAETAGRRLDAPVGRKIRVGPSGSAVGGRRQQKTAELVVVQSPVTGASVGGSQEGWAAVKRVKFTAVEAKGSAVRRFFLRR